MFDFDFRQTVDFHGLESFCFIGFNFCSFLFRLDLGLKKVERTHMITRWLTSSERYVTRVNESREATRLTLLQQLHQDTMKRAFLRSLLSKYFGRFYFINFDRRLSLLFWIGMVFAASCLANSALQRHDGGIVRVLSGCRRLLRWWTAT